MKLLHPRHLLRRAFTLIEVMVVISIFVLLLAIAVPAFSSMLYSSEQSLVENSVRIAITTARDYASRSPAGQDAAAVFLYDYESKKTSIAICTLAGTLQDAPPSTASTPAPVLRDVFAAAPGVESIQLTAGWTVRGYAPGGTIDGEWYELDPYDWTQGNWLLPETSFNDETKANSGDNRQSFMVRFEGGTGLVKTSSPNTAMVHFPSTSLTLRSSFPRNPPSVPGPNPFDPNNEADDLRYVRRVLEWPLAGRISVTLNDKRAILGTNPDGTKSADVVLCKAIGQLAVCSERRLARGIGVEIDKDTGCIYKVPLAPNAAEPAFVTGVLPANVNAWIEGHFVLNGEPVDSDCRIFTIQRYLGWLQEVTGTKDGMGISS